jgi:FkbM family methyltransferase
MSRKFPVTPFAWYIRDLGVRGALLWKLNRVREKYGLGSANLVVVPLHKGHPIHLRGRGSSDVDLFRDIFIREEYACLRDIVPSFIVDLGANIGLSSAWFLEEFPQARVLAVEPDPANFEQCLKNLAPYGDRATVIRGAVWSKRGTLSLSRGTFGDGREWATQVVDNVSGSEIVESFDIPTLIGGKIVDLLKIDIERSELELFSRGSENWLLNIRNICVELHGSDCEAAFFNALEDYEFDSSRAGELTICRNIRRSSSNQSTRTARA